MALLSLMAMLGLAVGSFLNVVIHRVPRGESVVAPRSHCPVCTVALRPWHTVPVFSWVAQRGRCATGRHRIGARYPLVEVGTAALFVAVTARIGLDPALPAYLYLAAVAVALAMIDLDVRRLPDAIVLPSYVVGGVLLAAAAASNRDWSAAARGVAAMLLLWLLYFGLSVTYPGGMGFGDVKLAGLLGLHLGWLGWSAVWVGTFVGFLLGGVVAVGLLVTRRAGRRTAIAFGPAMLGGALVAVFGAGPISSWYTALLMPGV
jgi:leader peptidase (prepilin peptidase) / N-methyltransferase